MNSLLVVSNLLRIYSLIKAARTLSFALDLRFTLGQSKIGIWKMMNLKTHILLNGQSGTMVVRGKLKVSGDKQALIRRTG
uniref:hypothetical protein n=1 Tax=Arcticibacter eurypsychrophilus TaxID=1434752 RepID=UPI00147D53E7|nr:hypothetical protein [Arcticibacter eurypsychrophilus]